MNDTRAITTSVDYHDILALTLPHNMSQFASMLVVTHPEDSKTIQVATECGADVFTTEVFYERNAVFNKLAAIEQGLDYLGRHGWLCIIDADIAIPHARHPWEKKIGKLYVPQRLIHSKIPDEVPLERRWGKCRSQKEGFSGHCQIFHASDPAFFAHNNWHPLHQTWAGTGDPYFERLWNSWNHARPPFRVLHIGETGKNWAGRVTPYADGSVDDRAEYRQSMFRTLMNQRKVHLLLENERVK